jgi:hypothetical protein
MPVWRFEPFGPERFPLGESPFRVRGLAYVTVLDYVNKKTPGGLAAVQQRLDNSPTAKYFEQLFVSLGDYDAAPLLQLFVVAASLESTGPAGFIERRSRASAKMDSAGMWKPLLSAKSLEQMIERLPVAFNRYYSPCRARVFDVTSRGFSGELSLVPEPMNGLYVFSTNGFVGACLELAGADNVRFDWRQPRRDGSLQDVATETLEFSARFDIKR